LLKNLRNVDFLPFLESGLAQVKVFEEFFHHQRLHVVQRDEHRLTRLDKGEDIVKINSQVVATVFCSLLPVPL
jgi:hypothetical protein